MALIFIEYNTPAQILVRSTPGGSARGSRISPAWRLGHRAPVSTRLSWRLKVGVESLLLRMGYEAVRRLDMYDMDRISTPFRIRIEDAEHFASWLYSASQCVQSLRILEKNLLRFAY